MNIFQKIIRCKSNKQTIAHATLKFIPVEENSEIHVYSQNEMLTIEKIADYGMTYQVAIEFLFEIGLNSIWVKKINDESLVFFPNADQRMRAMYFLGELEKSVNFVEERYLKDLSELTSSYIAQGRTQEEIDTLKDRVKKDLSWTFLLQDDAREDYASSAQITKTLIPDNIWQEKIVPRLTGHKINDNIPRLF